jgi:hypothetical protein
MRQRQRRMQLNTNRNAGRRLFAVRLQTKTAGVALYDNGPLCVCDTCKRNAHDVCYCHFHLAFSMRMHVNAKAGWVRVRGGKLGGHVLKLKLKLGKQSGDCRLTSRYIQVDPGT